jgi:hypothetical protein
MSDRLLSRLHALIQGGLVLAKIPVNTLANVVNIFTTALFIIKSSSCRVDLSSRLVKALPIRVDESPPILWLQTPLPRWDGSDHLLALTARGEEIF